MVKAAANRFIYLDYAATTPVDLQVAEFMAGFLTREGVFANPSSIHAPGQQAARAVEIAREQLAGLLNVRPADLIWTSGATESDNLAIIGGAHYRGRRGKHLVTMKTEHKAVLDAFAALQREGFEVSYVAPNESGLVSMDVLRAALREDTQLVSIMYVNNETGVVQDIEAIGNICRERDILFHVDAAQAVGKVALDLQALPVDLLSLTAHKFYGPKGIGALYVANRPGCQVEPILFGGGQERRLRPGTLPVHQIVGLGLAAELAASSLQDNWLHMSKLRHRLLAGISQLPGLLVNGDESERSYPGILNISALGVEGESLMLALAPVCVASGSACNAKNAEPSYVLRALGRDDATAQSAIRFSFGRYTTLAEVDFAAARYCEAIVSLRSIAKGLE